MELIFMAKTNKYNIEEFDEIIANDYKYCKKCKTETIITAKFCQNCGHNEFYSIEELNKLENSKYCTKCKALVSLNTKFCQNCGNNQFVKSLDEVDYDDVDVKNQKIYDDILKEIKYVKKNINKLNLNKEELQTTFINTKNDYETKYKKLKLDEENSKSKALARTSEIKDYNNKVSSLEKEINEFDSSIDNSKLVELKKSVKTETTKYNSLLKKYNKLVEEKEKFDSIRLERENKEKADKLAKEKEEKERLAKIKAEKQAKELQERLIKFEEERKANLYKEALRYYNDKKYNQSVKIFMELANKNYIDSYLFLGICYYKGQGIHIDYSKAFNYFMKAKDNKVSEAYFWLGCCYEFGNGTSKNMETAFSYYEQGARLGHVEAKYQTYLCYKNAKGTKRDKESELYYLEDAAKCKHYDAAYEYGVLSYKKKEYTRAFNYFKIASENNNIDAINYLAKLCYEMHGTAKVDAIKWYELASSLGSLDATFNLACVMDEFNRPNAIRYYKEAANKGHKEAQLIMSKFYKKGEPRFNIKKDVEISKTWLKKYKER